MQQTFEKNLQKMREQFQLANKQLEGRCERQLDELRAHLELRCRVEIHEIEERKNLHINDLMHNHERAFRQIRDYYNDITRDNLQLIDTLKNEVANMRRKTIINAKLMHDVSQENKRLNEPLTAALQEVQHLRNDLRDVDKGKRSLVHAKARLRALFWRLQELRTSSEELQIRYRNLVSDHRVLVDMYEHSIDTVAKKGECRNLVMEQRIQQMNDTHKSKTRQLDEIIAAAELNPSDIERLVNQLAEVLDDRNAQLKRLRMDVAVASKTYNDSLRTLTQRMADMSIPEEVIRDMDFQPHASNKYCAPAGLVVAD
ncbi:TPA: hypothetical protein N0F65_003057 [Lagenidium giganteum]|uniref:Growth arrest-specific protein 8 domain-containing protein n=1 Tax=Lagenidium giganteum TaxID=4803 RepID=A0AAV2YGK4_9STRA|nr:TPA: hypothetical protein N0F65_003057 [Lagenidium giganteum]